MKKLLTLVLILSIQILAYGQDKNQTNFILEPNKDIKVEVQRVKDSILTKNHLTKSKSDFQVNYHFDKEQLFYIRFKKLDNNLNKTFEVKRKMINGYGYYMIKADHKLDYFLPREKQGNEEEFMQQFAANPDFTDNDKLMLYAEQLNREIADYMANNIGSIAFYGDIIANKKSDFIYYQFDDKGYKESQKVKSNINEMDPNTKKYKGHYRLEFDRKFIKDFKTLSFSESLNGTQDQGINKQNTIQLDPLRKEMEKANHEIESTFNNDLLFGQLFNQIIKAKNETLEAEKNYIGTYKVRNREEKEIVFELRVGNVFFSKDGDTEIIGLWKLGKYRNSNMDAIDVSNLQSLNNKSGIKTFSSFMGKGFTLVLDGQKMLYPISLPEVWGLVEKVK